MNQATEMELREMIEKYVEQYPLKEPVMISIIDNRVSVVEIEKLPLPEELD